MLKINFRSKKVAVPLITVILLVLTLSALEVSETTHILRNGNQITNQSTGSAQTKGLKKSDSSQDQASTSKKLSSPAKQSTNNSQPGANKQQSGTSDGILIAPTGTFANIYKNVSADDNMQSTCNTSAGASCEILFTKLGVTRQLPRKQADTSGAVYWSWKPSSIGLTTGSWHITARSTNGSDTKVTDNGSLELEITQ